MAYVKRHKTAKTIRIYNTMFRNDMETLLTALAEAQAANDHKQMAECYLNLGTACRDAGKNTKAIYYVRRFDNPVGGDDDLYDKFSSQNAQVSQWIDKLESLQLPYEKRIQQQAVEKSQDLNELQKMQWILLTMSRFCTLFEKLSVLPDFEGFEKLSEMIDYICDGLYGTLDTDDSDDIQDALWDYDDLLDNVFDSEVMSDYTQTVQILNQPDFVPADLESGDVGTYYFGMAFGALQQFIFDEDGQSSECAIPSTAQPDDPVDMEFVACGILADYFYRTSDADLEKIPQIQEEAARIFSDYDFVKSAPDYQAFQQRIDLYKEVMLI